MSKEDPVRAYLLHELERAKDAALHIYSGLNLIENELARAKEELLEQPRAPVGTGQSDLLNPRHLLLEEAHTEWLSSTTA